MLTQERLKQLLQYDPSTGTLMWLVSSGSKAAGQTAGCLDRRDGYKKIRIDKKTYLFHRVVWLYMTGAWPENLLDHKNHIQDDNRWDNLREANKTLNAQNMIRAHKCNPTGLLGVHPRGLRFQAAITINGKQKCIGTFDTADQAHAAYLEQKRQHHEGNML